MWEEDREPTIWKKKRKEKTGVKSRDTLEKKRKLDSKLKVQLDADEDGHVHFGDQSRRGGQNAAWSYGPLRRVLRRLRRQSLW